MTELNINDTDDVVLALFLGFMGLAFIIYPLYSRFLKKGMVELDPKKWGRTTAWTAGRNRYVKQVITKYGKPPYQTAYETKIQYRVDGKVYTKYLNGEVTGKFPIYYKKKNPNHFKSVAEVKDKAEYRIDKVSFFLSICFGVFWLLCLWGLLFS